MALIRPPVVNAFANIVAGTPSDFWEVPATYDNGFEAPGGVPVRPDLGDVNWLFWFATLGVRYLLAGATIWDATETQYSSAAASTVQDSNGRYYVLRGNATTGTHPSADANWLPLNNLDRVPSASSGGDWVTPIAKWSSPSALARFTIDRWGLPRGSFFQNREIWSPNTSWGSVLNGSVLGPWGFALTGAQSAASGHNAGAASKNASNTAPSLELIIDGVNSGLNKIAAFYQPLSMMSADSLMIADFESTFPTDHTNFSFSMGIAGLGQTIDAVNDGAYFFANPGTTNWLAFVVNGGSQIILNTGVPVATGTGNPHKFSVALVGSSIADDSSPHALFYIDDQLMANQAGSGVPNSAGSPKVGNLFFGGQQAGAFAGNQSLVLGPTTYTQITKR